MKFTGSGHYELTINGITKTTTDMQMIDKMKDEDRDVSDIGDRQAVEYVLNENFDEIILNY